MNTRDPKAFIDKPKELAPDQVAEVKDFMYLFVAKEFRRQAGEALRKMWSRMPDEQLTEENEPKIEEAVRTKRRRCGTRPPRGSRERVA